MFDYHRAFSRNLGWVSEAEQELLKSSRVAIAGMGGVGGSHLLTLVRLGIGRFNLADFDSFGLENFNRQAGARMSTLGQPKLETLVNMALDINPELDIRTFPDGVKPEQATDFLSDCDAYVDALDFFALDARRAVFAACAKLGIPATTAAPLGMGAAILNFLPGQMTFEEYFRMEGCTENEQYLRFFMGLAPSGLQGRYLVQPERINLAEKRGPSTSMACELCAGLAATQVLKMLLNRGDIVAAPEGLHYDGYLNRFKRTRLTKGNDGPLQRVKLGKAREALLAKQHHPVESEPLPTPAHQVLDYAKWAPSGDNTQPWRFTVESSHSFVVHCHDTRDHVVYDLDGHSSHLAHGALLESIEVAAAHFGFHPVISETPASSELTPEFRVELQMTPEPPSNLSRLGPYLKLRCVQRRAMQKTTITPSVRQALEEKLDEGYQLLWLDGHQQRAMARLLARNARLRLTLPEAYPTHKEIIDWGQQYSQDKIPEQALGTDPLSGRFMKFALQSWKRVNFFNRFMAGALLPSLQLDYLPALSSGALLLVVAPEPCQSYRDYLQAGRNVQRLWLEATRHRLSLQPQVTPLIFRRYLHRQLEFTDTPELVETARRNDVQLSEILGADLADRGVFLARIGYGEFAQARSTRKPLSELLIQ